jgi:hypothetical protein
VLLTPQGSIYHLHMYVSSNVVFMFRDEKDLPRAGANHQLNSILTARVASFVALYNRLLSGILLSIYSFDTAKTSDPLPSVFCSSSLAMSSLLNSKP